MKRVFTLLLVLFAFTGCDDTDGGILCETGPVGFTFEVVNETTGDNLFENELFEENQLQITNSDGEAVVFDYETDRNVVNVLLGWESKSDVYTVTIGDEITFNFAFTLKKSSSGGCTSTKLTELEMSGATYETNETSDVTTIFVSVGGK